MNYSGGSSSNNNNKLRNFRNIFQKKDSPSFASSSSSLVLPTSYSSYSQYSGSTAPHQSPTANAKMGRKEFIKDVEALQAYFASLKPADARLVHGFKFHDPELTFSFSYNARKSFNIVLYINSISNYPSKFSGFLCVNDESGDRSVTNVAAVLDKIPLSNLPLATILSNVISACCSHFRIKFPRTLSQEVQLQYSPSLASVVVAPSSSGARSLNFSSPSSHQLLLRHLAECEHYLYKTHIFSADKVAIAFPAARLGLSEDACRAWNLDIERYIVCIMQFGTKYVNLGEVAAQVPSEKYSSNYGALKEAIKTSTPINFKVLTSTSPNPKYFFSNARPNATGSVHSSASDVSLNSSATTAAVEADQFILSWTLTDHLRTNLLPYICDRIWWNLGWESAEYAAAERMSGNPQFMNDGQALRRGELDRCLERESEFSKSAAHGLLSVLEQETQEASTEARNENFLLLTVRYLRRRILLCTNYCLICHRRQALALSTLKPFVCDSPLCQHQAQSVGLGKIFETEMVGNEVVIDLLISLCWAAVEAKALTPFPDQTVTASGLFPIEGKGEVRIVHINRDGVVGRSTVGGRGYRVEGDFETSDGITSPWAAQFKVGDFLSILHPSSRQPLPLSSTTLSTHVRVVYVSEDHILVDQPCAIAANLASFRSSLPFSIHRKMEQSFLNPASPHLPDYLRLETILSKLPHVRTMIASVHAGTLRRDLDSIDPLCYPLLSWIISSNRAHLRALDGEGDQVRVGSQGTLTGSNKTWRQFVMLMSSPEKEEEFQREKARVRKEMKGKGELYAWHGSRLENWHSIIRSNLNFNKVTNGRAYGNGVYMAIDATTSYGYCQSSNGGRRAWPQSCLEIRTCLSLNEVINRPEKFVSTTPYLVVKDEHWITTRYLFVECVKDPNDPLTITAPDQSSTQIPPTTASVALAQSSRRSVQSIQLDETRRPIFLGGVKVEIPERNYGLVADEAPPGTSIDVGDFVAKEITEGREDYGEMGDEDEEMQEAEPRERGSGKKTEEELVYSDFDEEDEEGEEGEQDDEEDDDFEYASDEDMGFDDADDVMSQEKKVEEIEEDDEEFDPSLLPLPTDATKSATQAIWRELRLIMKEQSSSSNPGFLLDASKLRSVYQWVVHLKDFDPNLPLAKDMRDRGVKSVDLEVRFSGEFPHVPPYIRVIRPRLLRFLHGGGGHVTAGGSICMDLLTLGNARDRGWSSIYRMDAVLLQIKLALSSTEPRPARLDPHAWNSEYTAREGMDAFIRVANDHGWRVPSGFRDMFSK